MRANPLLIAVGILVVLGGFAIYTMQNPPEPELDRVTLIDAKEDEVRKVTIRKPEGETIVVVRGEDDEWEFGEDIDAPASDSQIDYMITSLAGMYAERSVQEEVADWTPFGLEGEGALSVEAEIGAEKPVKVVFGKDTPTGASDYARLEGDPRLLTTANYVKSAFEKSVFDLRDKRLLRVDEDSISRVRLDIGSKSFEFGRSGERKWQILEPEPLRADNFAVGDLARSIREAEMLEVVSEDGGGDDRFDRPYAVAEVVDEAGAHTLTVAKQGDDEYYARSSDIEGVYKVVPTFAENLDKELNNFRNKKLFDFGFKELSKLDVRDGDKRAVIEKQDDQWALTSEDGRELASEQVQTLIDRLRNLSAIDFPSGRAEQYGLEDHVIEATVTPAEGGDAETVVLGDPNNPIVYAMRRSERSIYELEQSPVEQLREAIAAILHEETDADTEEGDADESN